MISAISNKETFLKTLAYAKNAEYKTALGAFEKAVTTTENATFRQLINDKPNTVDLFFRYVKQKPSVTLEEVMSLSLLTEKLAVNQLDDFIADFGQACFSDAVQKNAELVGSWKVLKEAGTSGHTNKIDSFKWEHIFI